MKKIVDVIALERELEKRLDILNADSFQNELKKISKAKVEFEPRVNGTPIDASMGDFFKYIKEVNKVS